MPLLQVSTHWGNQGGRPPMHDDAMSLEIAQLRAGMDAVEAAVRDRMAGHGADDLVAMRWRDADTISAVSIPEALHLDVVFVVRQISSVFSREQLEDSASRLRADVRLMVDELVRSLLANRH